MYVFTNLKIVYSDSLLNNKFTLIKELDYNFHNAHMFYLLFNNLNERNNFQNFLKLKNISTTFHYIPLHSSEAGIKYGKVSSEMKVTNHISDCLLRLPMWVGMDIDYIIKQIKTF